MKKNDLTYYLFEDKNKEYGSYILRKLYSRYMMIGLLIAIVLISAGFIYPWLKFKSDMKKAGENTMAVNYQKIISYSELSAPPPIEARTPPKQIEQVKIKTVKYVKPVVKKDEDVQDEELMPTVEELATTNTGFENVAGVDSISFEPAVEPPAPNPQPVEPFRIVEKMPEYPGGQGALIQYIVANVKYPDRAKEVNAQGTVYVEFIVGVDGLVRDVQVVRGIGFGCDEEAIRVVSSLPQWEPGQQQQQKVPVKMIVPIKFKLMN